MALNFGVLDRVNNAIPFFSYGEGYMEQRLDQYPFDEGGMKERWDMFDRLANAVMDCLCQEFPLLSERSRSIYCELQMCQLYEKIERIEQAYGCYCSLMAQYA